MSTSLRSGADRIVRDPVPFLPTATRRSVATALFAALTIATRIAAADLHADVVPIPSTVGTLGQPHALVVDANGFHGFATGYVQGQFEHHDDSEGQLSADGMRLLNADRFLVRRTRMLLGVERDFAAALVEFDANTVHGVGLGIRQAEATLRYSLPSQSGGVPLVALSAGMMLTPFGYEIPMSARDRVWMENSTVSEAFFPGESDLGVRLRGGLGWFRYSLALMNGHPLDEPRFGAQAPLAPNDWIGRLGFALALGSTRINGGASALVGNGFHPGTPATKDMLVIHDVTETGAITPQTLQLVPGRAATPSQTFDHWAVGLDFALDAHPFAGWNCGLYAELFLGQNMDRAYDVADPIATGFDLREFGVVFGYTQLLRDLVILGMRVEYYNPNADAVARQGGHIVQTAQDVVTTSFLAGLEIPHTQARLVAQYDAVRDHLTIATDGSTSDLRNDRVTVRLQVAF